MVVFPACAESSAGRPVEGDSQEFFYDNYIDLYRFTRLLKGRCRHLSACDAQAGRRIKEKAGELLRSLRPEEDRGRC